MAKLKQKYKQIIKVFILPPLIPLHLILTPSFMTGPRTPHPHGIPTRDAIYGCALRRQKFRKCISCLSKCPVNEMPD